MEIGADIFREYDIRGVVGKDLTEEKVEGLGKAFGTYLRERGRGEAVVGRDNRLSSRPFREAMIRGLRSTGCNVVDIGLVVTPNFYFAQIDLGIDAGVMITASHNPAEFNGFKLSCGPGTIYGEEIQAIYKLMLEDRFALGAGGLREDVAVPTYLDMLAEKITLERKLKVVVDAGNGTASFFAPSVLRRWGCEVIPLYCDSDPTFPHHFPDPVRPENLVDLRRMVVSEGADVGIALDGDSDRIGVVDNRGEILWGDILMALYWREIMPKHPGARVIVEVKCSRALIEEATKLGGKPEFYKTGHSLLKARMRETGAVFTGEVSGHMFFADEYYGFDDAMYATGRLLRLVSRSSLSLAELTADIPRYPTTPETRVDCPDEEKFQVVEKVREHFRREYPVVDVDGVRVIFPDGWGLIRGSNTQAVLVLRAEADTVEGLERIKKCLEDALTAYPSVGRVQW